uniref:Cell surface spherulin 4-like protein n=1 Tax=Mycena chlorophos TaxID=658473 RepID=A0ABQ0LL30_MYCCL|nr:predicted protein [Mycena chlorophos]
MHALSLSLLLLTSTTIVSATDLLLPLYTDPGSSGANWATVQSSLANNPSLAARVVINVDNGPGNPFAKGGDGANWVAGASALADLPNVSVLGYVHTTQATRAYTEVIADVNSWASWVTSHGVALDGIFLDEAPASVCSSCVTYMRNLTTYIRDTAELPFVVYNPGFPATVGALDDYYAIGPDLINALETCFAETSDGEDLCTPAGSYTIYDEDGYGTTIDSTLESWVGTQYYSQTSILIHGFHGTNGLYSATSATLSSELQAIVERGIGAAVFTTDQWITPDVGPADITTVADLLNEANGA